MQVRNGLGRVCKRDGGGKSYEGKALAFLPRCMYSLSAAYARAQGCARPLLRTSRPGRGVVCPDIWVFGKTAYLPTPTPTMTTRLVQPK